MTQKQIIKWGIIAAIAEFIYIVIIAFVLYNIGNISPTLPAFVDISLILILFVFSAAISSIFVLGYPIYLILQKKIKEAVLTLLITLFTMLTIFICAIILIYLIK